MAKRMIKSMMDRKDMKMMRMMKMKCMYMAFGFIILGALILANTYWTLLSWSAFVGWIFVLAGLWKLLMHNKCVM